MAVDRTAGSRFAGFRVDSLVGRGGMGIVYRATEMSSGRAVALKLIAGPVSEDPIYRARFEREARLSAQLDHPHVVRLYDSGDHEGVLYLATEFIDGVDLQALIASAGPLHPVHATELVSQIASALDAAAELGLVHRDVKPANVLVQDREGKVHAYLTDFGLAKHVASQSGLTGTGVWVGTVDYAAPEQIQGGEVDARTDVYALGCVLHEALSGQAPFASAREVEKLRAHLAEPPRRPSELNPGVPAELDEVIARALAKRPDDRYAGAGELAKAAVSASVAAGAPPGPLLLRSLERPAAVDRNAPTVG